MNHRLLVTIWIMLLALGEQLVARPKNFIFSDTFLSSNLINDLYQDKDGILWISTENGLNRYDGAKMTCYFHDDDNPRSLAHDFVRYVYQDRAGRIYVGSYIGLQLYRPDTDDFTPIAKYEDGSWLKASPSYLTEMHDGRIYTSGNALCEVLVRDGQPYLRDIEWQNVNGMIGRLHEDQLGHIWCRNSVGDYYKVTPQGVETIHQFLPGHTVIEVHSDQQRNIYLTTDRQDMLKYDPQADSWRVINRMPVSGSAIKCICRLDSTHLLVGTDGNGMKWVDEASGLVRDYPLDLPGVASDLLKVHRLMRDRHGDLWAGLFMKGVAHLPMSQSSFEYIGPHTSSLDLIGSSSVSALMAARDGQMWVGTDGDGIYLLDAALGTSHHYFGQSSRGHFPSIVLTLFEDSKDRVWVGTYGEGGGRIDPQSGRYQDCSRLFCREDNVASRVYAYAEDDQRRLWVATSRSMTASPSSI